MNYLLARVTLTIVLGLLFALAYTVVTPPRLLTEPGVLDASPGPAEVALPALTPTLTFAEPPAFSQARELLALPPLTGAGLLVSPNGKLVAYTRLATLSQRAVLYVSRLENGEIWQVFSSSGPIRYDWFPDSHRLMLAALVAEPDRYGLAMVSADGSGLRWIGGPPEANFGIRDLAVSPDGGYVAYTALIGVHPALTSQAVLEIVRSSGGAPQRLAGPAPSLREPRWTPDGRGLVFFQGRPQGFSSGDSYLVDLVTKGKRLIFPGGRLLSWSPDGRYALWLGDLNSQTGERGLWRSQADGSQPDILAVDVGLLQASWTASADWVVYRSVLGGVSRLWLSRADRNEVKLLAEGGVFNPVWLPKSGLIYRSLEPQSEKLVLLPLRAPR